jgi:ATP-dependent RNA helicase DDX46/PRP5
MRRDRSFSPETSNKRVRPSHRSPRSPSPTRRNIPRTSTRSRYDEDRDRERDRVRDRDRERDRGRERDRDRYRDDRHHREDRRRDGNRDDRRPERRDDRKSSRDRRDRDRSPPPPTPSQPDVPSTPPIEDEKLKAKRAKLEAWKKDRDAKKALDEAKAKAMALAGKSAPGKFHVEPGNS